MTNHITLEAGDPAPAFRLPVSGDKTVELSDFAGRNLVLYFYPRDDTPGCTTEALDFTAAADSFAAANTSVIGVSKDTLAKHEKFAAKHSLGVQLGSDAEGTTCEEYGVWVEKSMYGKTFLGIERATFLIGPDGRIAKIWRKVKVKGHVADVLAAAGAL